MSDEEREFYDRFGDGPIAWYRPAGLAPKAQAPKKPAGKR